MPDFSEMLYGTAEKATNSSEVYDTYYKVAQIGLQKEANVQKRKEFEQQKAQLDEAKISKLFEYVGKADKFKNQGDRNNYLKMGLQYRNSLGIDSGRIPDSALTTLASDDMMGRMATIKARVLAGKMSVKDVELWMQSPQLQAETPIALPEFASTDPSMMEAFKTRMGWQNMKEISKTNKATTQAEINDRFDRSKMAELSNKIITLGLPGIESAMEGLNQNIPGGLAGWKPGMRIPGVSGAEGALAVNRLSGQGLKVRQYAQSLGNQILKLRSGAAINEAEADRLFAELGMVPVMGEGGTIKQLVFKGITSDEVFMQGMRGANDVITNIQDEFKGGYTDEIYERVRGKKTSKTSSKPTTIKFKGEDIARAEAEAYIKANPKAPDVAEMKKALGVK